MSKQSLKLLSWIVGIAIVSLISFFISLIYSGPNFSPKLLLLLHIRVLSGVETCKCLIRQHPVKHPLNGDLDHI